MNDKLAWCIKTAEALDLGEVRFQYEEGEFQAATDGPVSGWHLSPDAAVNALHTAMSNRVRDLRSKLGSIPNE